MKKRELNRLCPICAGKQGEILTHVHMTLGAGIKIPDSYDVVSCENCGFTFADVNANQDVYNEYYASDNCYSCEGDIKALGKNVSIECMKNFILKYVKKDERILDIGCGSGDLLKILKRNGYVDLTGLDPSQASLERLKELGIKTIKRNIFEPIQENEVRYNTIISTCVMEHILDLNNFLKIVESYLEQDGRFFVVVPSVEGFQKYYQLKPNYFNHEHINYFSKVSLKNLMMKHSLFSLTENDGEYYCVGSDLEKQDLMLENIFEINKEKQKNIEYDSKSKESIEKYIIMDNKASKKLDAIIKKVNDENRRLIIWGAGSLAMTLMANDNFAEYVDGFVDNNDTKIGKNILGKEVYTPEILKGEKFKDHLLLIACMRYSDSILRQIHDVGIDNEVIVY